jgi:hypothetical protein
MPNMSGQTQPLVLQKVLKPLIVTLQQTDESVILPTLAMPRETMDANLGGKGSQWL